MGVYHLTTFENFPVLRTVSFHFRSRSVGRRPTWKSTKADVTSCLIVSKVNGAVILRSLQWNRKKRNTSALKVIHFRDFYFVRKLSSGNPVSSGFPPEEKWGFFIHMVVPLYTCITSYLCSNTIGVIELTCASASRRVIMQSIAYGLLCMKMNLQEEHIFIWMVWNEDYFVSHFSPTLRNSGSCLSEFTPCLFASSRFFSPTWSLQQLLTKG